MSQFDFNDYIYPADSIDDLLLIHYFLANFSFDADKLLEEINKIASRRYTLQEIKFLGTKKETCHGLYPTTFFQKLKTIIGIEKNAFEVEINSVMRKRIKCESCGKFFCLMHDS
jgi:hypothetical protein